MTLNVKHWLFCGLLLIISFYSLLVFVYSNFAFCIMSLYVHVRTCDFRLIQEQIRPLMDFVILYLRVVKPVRFINFEILV